LPEVVVPAIVKALQSQGDRVEGVWMGKEVNTEEVNTEARLRSSLQSLSVKLTLHANRSLVHPDDLGFEVRELPDIFTNFRKRVEGVDMYREPLPTPTKLKPFATLPESLTDQAGAYRLDGKAGLDKAESVVEALLKPLRENPGPLAPPKVSAQPQHSAFPFVGGETEALKRLDDYIGVSQPGRKYKQTRNGMLGVDYSTKFSAALAHGLISPRLLASRAEQMDHDLGDKGKQGGYWIVFELLWRDYFHFVGQKYGSSMFTLEGIEARLDSKSAQSKAGEWLSPNSLSDPDDAFVRWTQGKTGIPLIDANMLELAATGFMSNRGRQNVASFLTKDLYYDWRLGAEWFESSLSDYDCNSNWLNWAYVAGVGNDPRSSRQFNPIKQANDYDPNADYVKAWLPQLRALPANLAQHPWTAAQAERPKDYPAPVVENPSWKKHYNNRNQGNNGSNNNTSARGGRGGGRGGGGARGRGRGRGRA